MNENNLLVGLMVLAIVVAVAGTWVNLQSMQSKYSVITGMAAEGADVLVTDNNNNDMTGVPTIAVGDTSGDCAFASHQAALFGGETGWCNAGNWSANMQNFTVNAWNNFAKYYVDVTVAQPFVESDYYLGYAVVSGASDGETTLSGWGNIAGNCEITPAEVSDTCKIASNITGVSNRTIQFSHGGALFWNESQNTYTVNFTVTTVGCTAATCPAADS